MGTEVAQGLVDGGCGGLAGQVCGGDGHRADVGEQREEGFLGGHADADRSARFAQVPAEVGAGFQDQRESAGPEGAGEAPRVVGGIDAQGVDRVG